ncbi:MAG TPA: AAA family ATPase [Candidatus Hydrogenedentes bacterium]|nr:AAA family ATPase [Candidatus Hydrogenedentota bacterium]HOV74130.1 AAA family ATPase [Candidatus Hydrogenedentota bacterium]
MYEAFYGLSERPFNLTPDPRYLFLSEKHKEAFAHLMFGIRNRTGFVMVTGEIGTGKTTICRSLLNQLDADTEVAFIFNPYLSPDELLRKINEDFGIESRAGSIKELVDELNGYLLDRAAHGKNCVLVIDESQDLKPGVLEQIRLLSNLETESQKLLQIVLIGQPELARNLQLDELRQLNQRITARYHLKPLNREETIQYIAYRLHVAGGRKKVHFTKGALRTIFRLSGGTPRVINAICDRALLIGYTREIREIPASVVRRASREIRGETIRAKGALLSAAKRFLPNPAWIGTTAAILVLIAAFVPVWRWLQASPVSEPIKQASATVQENKPIVSDRIAVEPMAPPAPVEAVPVVAPVSVAPAEPPPQPPIEKPETAPMPVEAFEKLDPAQSRGKAVSAIMRAWNMAVVGDQPKDGSDASITGFARANGLACEMLALSVEELVAIGLPALAQVKTAQGPAWIALMRADDGLLHITTGEEPAVVTKDVFASVFAGKAAVYWRDPEPAARVLKRDMEGPDVERLQEALRALGRLPEAAKGRYDERTARAVAKLQAEAGLMIDGMAGRQVRMILSSLLPDSPTPSLDEKKASVKREARQSRKPEPAASMPESVAQTGPQPAVPAPDAAPLPEIVQPPPEVAVAAPPAPDSVAQVAAEDLDPPPRDDRLGPPKVEASKEVTPPVTASPPLVPRSPREDEASKSESQS